MEPEDSYLLFLRINPGADYGKIKVGPLELTWFNPNMFDDGAFYLALGKHWELRTAYYRSFDSFTGIPDGDHSFPDWEIIVYKAESTGWKRSFNITGRIFSAIDRVKQLFRK